MDIGTFNGGWHAEGGTVAAIGLLEKVTRGVCLAFGNTWDGVLSNLARTPQPQSQNAMKREARDGRANSQRGAAPAIIIATDPRGPGKRFVFLEKIMEGMKATKVAMCERFRRS